VDDKGQPRVKAAEFKFSELIIEMITAAIDAYKIGKNEQKKYCNKQDKLVNCDENKMSIQEANQNSNKKEKLKTQINSQREANK
jgi:hypothetical protein